MSHNLAWYHPHDRLRLHRATYIDLTRMKSVVKNTSQNLGEGVPNDWRVSQYRHRLHWDWHSYLTQQFCCPLFITILKKKAIPAQGTGVRQPWECYTLQNLFNWHIYYIQHCALTRELLVRTQRVGVSISTWSFKSQRETRVFPSQLLQL